VSTASTSEEEAVQDESQQLLDKPVLPDWTPPTLDLAPEVYADMCSSGLILPVSPEKSESSSPTPFPGSPHLSPPASPAKSGESVPDRLNKKAGKDELDVTLEEIVLTGDTPPNTPEEELIFFPDQSSGSNGGGNRKRSRKYTPPEKLTRKRLSKPKRWLANVAKEALDKR